MEITAAAMRNDDRHNDTVNTPTHISFALYMCGVDETPVSIYVMADDI